MAWVSGCKAILQTRLQIMDPRTSRVLSWTSSTSSATAKRTAVQGNSVDGNTTTTWTGQRESVLLPSTWSCWGLVFIWHNGSTNYPRRSLVPDLIPGDSGSYAETMRAMTIFFDCLLQAILLYTQLCREVGITRKGFHDLLVKREFIDFQKFLAGDIMKLYNKAKAIILNHPKRLSTGTTEDAPFNYQKYIEVHKQEVKPEFEAIAMLLKSQAKYASYRPNEPGVLICLDAAQELTLKDTTHPEMRFEALQAAFRNRSMDVIKPDKTFFGILIDTTCHVPNVSARPSRDPAARWISTGRLFPPIYQIHTMDLFSQSASPSTDIDVKRLFSLGRLLWGSVIEQQGISAALRLAQGHWYSNTVTSVVFFLFGLSCL